jgi:predicted Zn finger-like uncharacterized protein
MQIKCPKCHRQLRVADTAAGKLVRCPGCGGTFQAVDTVEEYVQTKPPPRPARPPVEEEEPPPRRRRDEDEDDRPRRRRAEDEDDDDRPRSRRKSYEDDYDDDDIDNYKSRRKEARRVAKSAGLWFMISGIVTIVTLVLSIVSNLILSASIGGMGGPAMVRIVGVLGCGVVLGVGAVLEILARAGLNSFKGKGVVITAIVLGFVFGLLFGGGAIFNLLVFTRLPLTGLTIFGFVAIILGGATSFLNLFAAIKGIVALNNAAVSRAFRSG